MAISFAGDKGTGFPIQAEVFTLYLNILKQLQSYIWCSWNLLFILEFQVVFAASFIIQAATIVWKVSVCHGKN